MVSFLHTRKEVLFMNEATANRVLKATLSQAVDELLGYKYGFYRPVIMGTQECLVVIPGSKHKYYQVYLINLYQSNSYCTLRVSKHVLKYLLINYLKHTEYFKMAFSSKSPSRYSFFAKNTSVLKLQLLGFFNKRPSVGLGYKVEDIFKVEISIEELAKYLDTME